ncbi:MAG: hypothetical protein C5B44_04105 [Acidobacteria bacterium]|nr:MAG: hypothetical protein C5B44_04105 [Acidobacteriota bacterium]
MLLTVGEGSRTLQFRIIVRAFTLVDKSYKAFLLLFRGPTMPSRSSLTLTRGIHEFPIFSRLVGANLLLVITALCTFAQSPPTGLVSISRFSNGGGDQYSPGESMRVSSNGRYVVFVSLATNLVPNDTNNTGDVFVRDQQTGQMILVSVNAAGTGPANVGGSSGVITPDGRYVAFVSSSSDLVTDDTAVDHGNPQIYIRDLQTGITRLVSRNIAGTGHSNSFVTGGPAISDDGRFVVFSSRATDLVSTPDTNNDSDVFVRDVQTNTTRLVSVRLDGAAAGNRNSQDPIISGDGRFVAFTSSANDLIALDSGPRSQAFIRDLQNNVTKLVTPNRFGTSGANGDIDSQREKDMAISTDGRYVAFVSGATDLVANDPGLTQDVFVRDTQLGTTTLVSVNGSGTSSGSGNSGQISMTPDGRYIAFISGADNLVANDSNLDQDVFVRDLQANTTSLITITTGGIAGGIGFPDTQFIRNQIRPTLSANGRYVGFSSKASNLTPGPDTNGGLASFDIFIRDRQANTTKLITMNYSGTDSGGGGGAAFDPLLSADGKLIFFSSAMSDLVGFTDSSVGDLFVSSNLPQPDQVRFKVAVTNVNESAGTATVSVVLPGAQLVPVSINFNTTNGTAVSGSDYVATSGTLNFGPGETEKTFTVSILDDSVIETDETIVVRLSGAAGGIVLGEPSVAAIKIVDDEPPPSLRISDVTTHEGDSGQFPAQFKVSLSAPTQRGVSVVLTTQPGTATSNVDFVGGSIVVNFAPGQTELLVSTYTIGDFAVEGTEEYFINLSSPVNATIADGQGVVTIIDDDAFLILTEENSQRAAALDSVQLMRDSLPVNTDLNFSSDHTTRVAFFVIGLRLNWGEPASAIVATAEDSHGNVWPLTVESANDVSTGLWLEQVVVKLNNQITAAGDYKIKFTLHGTSSNTVLLALRPQ